MSEAENPDPTPPASFDLENEPQPLDGELVDLDVDEKQPAEESSAETEDALLKRMQVLQRPTWELELLISGALVFSLFQLPGRLRAWFEGIQPHTSTDVGMLPFMTFYFLTLIVICLAIAFTLHFVLRSIWVGLTGLRSVFPKGIEWDKVDIGPVARSIYREMNPNLRSAEDRVDRIASSIFAILFALLMSFGGAFVLLMVPMVLVEILRVRFFPQVPTIAAFYAVILVVLLPTGGVGLLDSWFKKDLSRVERHPALFARALSASRFIQRLFMAQLSSPVILTLSSRFSLKAVTGGMTASIFIAVAIFLGFFAMTSGSFGFDSYVFFPQRGGVTRLTANHYEDQRSPTEASGLPTLPSEVIASPFLRLFVPFHVGRDPGRVLAMCPDLEAERTEGFFLRRRLKPDDNQVNNRLLECVTRAYVVQIDGEDAAGDWSFAEHPTNGLKGLVLYVSTQTLAHGRHELLVGRLPGHEESVYVVPTLASERSGSAESVPEPDPVGDPAAGPAVDPTAEIDGAEGLVMAYRDRFTLLFWFTGNESSGGLASVDSPKTRGELVNPGSDVPESAQE